ncbi:RagB/SusD family nutrient uptake outer membrane protein [Flammeovirga sp. MY04]|uniref:RagB/SusD family nutrient uptake outer membrane protein n=1 Tax=Flammeovirga sp. MY04 TaxID=1191459 RepID=UPI0008062B4C|nr:RagB/SusD family nutrient uptake outer membrane protein [Flammeovirga sp. MY04]ANQ52495.1 RagB/SusD family nutrient uptake outer membrane protein [Flammeovirga sp. MY04]
MKNKLIIFLSFVLFATTSCLKEDPPFLSDENLFETDAGVQTAVNGIYASVSGFNYYSSDFFQLTGYHSGSFMSGRNVDFNGIAALNPLPNLTFVENVWNASYQAINRANETIIGVEKYQEDPSDVVLNELGQTYFLRGLMYYNLVRLYGGVPIRTGKLDINELHIARSTEAEVYNQAISDLHMADSLLNEKEAQTLGRPAKSAANMLLAKIYMTLAGNDSNSEYWKMAETEALKVYGKYMLMPDYHQLWIEGTRNNNMESIFEMQYSMANSGNVIRLHTPSNAFSGNSWGRILINPEYVDPDTDKIALGAFDQQDPRFEATIMYNYMKYNNDGTENGEQKIYPITNRNNKNSGFPFVAKYWINDHTKTTPYSDANFTVMRYAELLLMLGEISNELGKTGEGETYVNEVLNRARNSAGGDGIHPIDWSGLTQDEFRTKIMNEYRYELLGEGGDWFRNRRRGLEFFQNNIINFHNDFVLTDGEGEVKGIDIFYENAERAMLLPIPATEINTNQLIGSEHQNPGY